jgi:hypothetical protein
MFTDTGNRFRAVLELCLITSLHSMMKMKMKVKKANITKVLCSDACFSTVMLLFLNCSSILDLFFFSCMYKFFRLLYR